MPDALAAAVKRAVIGEGSAADNALLEELGLLTNGRLSDEARAIDDAYWVRRKPDLAAETVRAIYLRQPVIQILMQGLQGTGPTPVEGALHILQRHGAASDNDLTELRALLDLLNPFDLLRYSRKFQTVRVVAGPEEQPESPPVRIIDPERPFSNQRHLRETLRECDDYIWWVERSFPRRGLELLQDVVEAGRIAEVRILSSGVDAPDKTVREFARFETEMGALGIKAAWRVLTSAPFHDRFVISKSRVWNVPPVNTLLRGDYSEIIRTPARPPFETWWKSAIDLAKAVGP